jgi:hypothetical protein
MQPVVGGHENYRAFKRLFELAVGCYKDVLEARLLMVRPAPSEAIAASPSLFPARSRGSALPGRMA